MKNKNIIFILVFISFILIIRYFTISYNIKYKINDYEIIEKYNKHNIYFEISDGNYKFNFDMNLKRGLFKKKIIRIEMVNYEDEICIYPIIKNSKTYPLCNKNGENISYYLVQNDSMKDFINSIGLESNIQKSNDTFKFYNSLSKGEYIAVYKYNGFYILNEDKIKSINIFNNDRYDNSLCLNKDSLLIIPEEKEYEFKKFIVIDMKTNKYYYIDSLYDVSFESIFLGYIKDKVYLLDKKNNKEYEIDLKKKEVNLIGDYEKGFKVYKDGKLKTGMISELKEEAFNQKDYNSLYSYEVIDNKLYRIIKNNPNIKNTIYNGEVKIIKINNEELFFLDNDTLYKYDPLNGLKTILVNEEMNYNKTNFIYIYINN